MIKELKNILEASEQLYTKKDAIEYFEDGRDPFKIKDLKWTPAHKDDKSPQGYWANMATGEIVRSKDTKLPSGVKQHDWPKSK